MDHPTWATAETMTCSTAMRSSSGERRSCISVALKLRISLPVGLQSWKRTEREGQGLLGSGPGSIRVYWVDLGEDRERVEGEATEGNGSSNMAGLIGEFLPRSLASLP